MEKYIKVKKNKNLSSKPIRNKKHHSNHKNFTINSMALCFRPHKQNNCKHKTYLGTISSD